MAKRDNPKPVARDAFDAAFARAQVEWALWRIEPANMRRKPSSIFRVRVKHLLEFDRSAPLKRPYASFAFSDEPPGGRGEHSLFSAYDALLLSIGLTFLDMGFKRKEVVLALRTRREAFCDEFGPSLTKELKSAARAIPFHDPDPVQPANLNRYTLLMPRIEPSVEEGPSSLKHLVCRSPKELADALTQGWASSLVAVDLTTKSHRLPSLLLYAPQLRRGQGNRKRSGRL